MGFAPTIPWDREELDLNMPYKEGWKVAQYMKNITYWLKLPGSKKPISDYEF